MGHQSLSLFVAVLFLLAAGCDTSDLKPETPGRAPQPTAQVQEDTRPQKVEMGKPVEEVEVGGYMSSMAAAHRNSRERIESLGVTQAISFYYAEHGKYPKSHEEFMKKCWLPLQSPFPPIEPGYEYRYFPEDHQVYKVLIEEEPAEGEN